MRNGFITLSWIYLLLVLFVGGAECFGELSGEGFGELFGGFFWGGFLLLGRRFAVRGQGCKVGCVEIVVAHWDFNKRKPTVGDGSGNVNVNGMRLQGHHERDAMNAS